MPSLGVKLLRLVPLLVTGCVAVWGKIYNRVFADGDLVGYEYDSALVTMPLLYADAMKYCKPQGRRGVQPLSDERGFLGLRSKMFQCRDEPDYDQRIKIDSN